MPYKRSLTDIHTLPDLKTFRTELRKHLTPAEASFWNLVKNSNLDGRKFRRQQSVGRYILDFYCPSESLGIELDGEVHYNVPVAEFVEFIEFVEFVEFVGFVEFIEFVERKCFF